MKLFSRGKQKSGKPIGKNASGKSSTKPNAKPVAKASSKPAAKASSKPATKSTSKPATKVASGSAPKKPAQKVAPATKQPTSKPTATTASNKPKSTPTSKPAQKSITTPANKPVSKASPRASAPSSAKLQAKTVSKSAQETAIMPVTIKRHSDNNGGHPHVIIEDIDDKHVSVGLSTKPNKGKGSKNYKLDVDPLGGNKESYMRRQGTVAPKTEYTKPQQGKMTPKDFTRATEYGEKAKQKYIEKSDKKK